MSIDDILALASKLSASERLDLAERLLASLGDDARCSGAESSWRAELERRCAEIDRGDVQLVPWETVLDEAQRRLAQ